MKQSMNKRGVGGLGFLKEFMLALTVVVVLAFALVILGANLKSSTSDTTAQGIITNFSTGISSIGNSIPTWVTLAGLVVIIGIISVVIYLVQRFGGGSDGSVSS